MYITVYFYSELINRQNQQKIANLTLQDYLDYLDYVAIASYS